MTYGEFKQFVLSLINQATIRGDEIEDSYNDQADYTLRIPMLYNDAAGKVATEGKAYVATMDLDSVEKEDAGNGFTIITPPDGFIKMTGDGIPLVRGGRMTRLQRYYMVGNKLYVRNDLMRGVIEYEKEPDMLPITPDENTELDGDREQQFCAAYYVAAMIIAQADAFMYSVLMNEYNDRLNNMKTRLWAETFEINDAMGVSYPFIY